jgi:DNA-binding NtrC family response regulator
VAATNRALDLEVRAQRFREDLYFRLGLARVHLLPLRDRRCEVPVLFRELLAQAATRARRKAPEPSPQVLEQLLRYDWPGNVRELKSVADFILATVEGDRIEPGDLPVALTHRPPPGSAPPSNTGTAPRTVDRDSSMRSLAAELEEIERHRMVEALTRTRGVKTRAAAMLGMPIRTFNMKIRKYALQYSGPRESRTAGRDCQ